MISTVIKNTKPNVVENLQQEGMILVNRGEYEQAFERLKLLVDRKPEMAPDILISLYKKLLGRLDDLKLRYLIAQVYFTADYYKDTVCELEELLDIESDFAPAFFLLSKVYYKEPLAEGIKEIFEDVFYKDILDPVVLDLLAKIYMEENNVEKNIVLYQKIIKYFPQRVTAYKVLAELYPKIEEYEKAALMYEQLVGLSISHLEAALSGCEKLLRLDSQNIKIRYILVNICIKYRKPLAIVKYLEDILRIDHTQASVIVKIYKDALALYPDTAEILLGLAVALYETDQYTESVANLQKVFQQNYLELDRLIDILYKILEKFPKQILALMLLTDIYIKKVKYRKALDNLTILVDENKEEFEILKEKTLYCLENSIETKNYAQYVLSKAYFAHGDLEKSLEESTKLWQTDFDLPGRFLQVEILKKTDRYSKAMDVLFEALKHYKHSWELHIQIKELQQDVCLREIAKKEEPSKKEIDKDKSRFELGLLCLRRGDIYRALENFQQINEKEDLKVRAQILIGRCFFELNRFDLAIEKFLAVLANLTEKELSLANMTRYLLAMNYINMGNIAEAVKVLETVMMQDINFPNIKNLVTKFKQESFLDLSGKSLAACGNMLEDESLSLLIVKSKEAEKLLRKKKNWQNISFAHPHNNQGVEYMLQQNFKSAEEEFLLAVQLDPAFVTAHCNLALLYISRKNYEEAQKYLDRVKFLDKKLDLLYLLTGLLEMKRSDLDKAKEHFKKCLDLNKDNYLAHLNLGDVHFKQHDIIKAFYCWQKAAEAENTFYLIQRRMNYLKRESFGFVDWIKNSLILVSD